MCNHYQKIVQIMQDANAYIQYPRIHLNNDFVLQRAGGNSKYVGAINITDGKPFGTNQWFGRIGTNGVLTMPNYMQKHGEKLQCELDLFQLDPARYATMYGKATANCMFCHKALTDPQSIAVGYGPTCAAHYGLPHGEMDAETAKKMSSLQFDIETIVDKACGKKGVCASCTNDKPTVTAESVAIEHLREVAIIMLSDIKHEQFAELIEINPEDEYMLLVTALWEAL